MTTSKQRVDRAEALLDYAKSKPAGFTTYEAVAHLGCSEAQFKRSVRDLKRMLAADTMNVAWFPHDFRYKLVGSFVEAAQPRHFGASYMDTRIESELAQASSYFNSAKQGDPEYLPALLWKATMTNLRTMIQALRDQ